MEDIDEYDKKCKVEPLMRALKDGDTEAWVNGRRRDHGFERAALPLWEGTKVLPRFSWRRISCPSAKIDFTLPQAVEGLCRDGHGANESIS